MAIRLTSLLLIVLLLAACGKSSLPENNEIRRATFTLVLNDIRARLTAEAEMSPVSLGARLETGGQARSGEDSRACLDLEPEGTIIRLGSNTLFTLAALGQDQANPTARLHLDFGQLWIILSGGSLDVESDFGSASVRGSYMSVAFDSQTGMQVTCLEGHCSLTSQAGTVELAGGQSSHIPAKGAPPSPPARMDEQEVQAWEGASPEAVQLLTSGTPGASTPAAQNGTPAPGSSSPQPRLNTQPLKYTLTNNCTDPSMGALVGDWRWQFVRLPDSGGSGSTEEIIVPSGQTVSGELPPGMYSVTDWFPNGEQHGPNRMNSDGSDLQVQNCPGGGKKPGQP